MGGYHAYDTLRFIWDKAICLYTNHGRRKGGTSFLINHVWVDRIIGDGTSPCQRAQWVLFKHVNKCFGICNLYDANEYKNRALFWDWLSSNLPKVNWIFIGDFNMIESGDDKCGDIAHGWKGNEIFFWNNFKRKFNLIDPRTNKKTNRGGNRYTWHNN